MGGGGGAGSRGPEKRPGWDYPRSGRAEERPAVDRGEVGAPNPINPGEGWEGDTKRGQPQPPPPLPRSAPPDHCALARAWRELAPLWPVLRAGPHRVEARAPLLGGGPAWAAIVGGGRSSRPALLLRLPAEPEPERGGDAAPAGLLEARARPWH